MPSLTHLTIELQTASANYNWRDWLQGEAGFLFVPTNWRTHRYQSTNLTVDEPLIDQNVFPTAFKGIMLHGDKYFEDGGFSYQIYGGVSQELEIFDTDAIFSMDQLRLAVRNGENDQLDKLIGKVMEQDAPFAGALRDLADKYEYDALIQLLEKAPS